MDLEMNDHNYHITSNHFVFIDCYQSHSYSTSAGWEYLWCHFDGITARACYENIVNRLGMYLPCQILIRFCQLTAYPEDLLYWSRGS